MNKGIAVANRIGMDLNGAEAPWLGYADTRPLEFSARVKNNWRKAMYQIEEDSFNLEEWMFWEWDSHAS